jgi:hypothetical protein
LCAERQQREGRLVKEGVTKPIHETENRKQKKKRSHSKMKEGQNPMKNENERT